MCPQRKKNSNPEIFHKVHFKEKKKSLTASNMLSAGPNPRAHAINLVSKNEH